MKTLTAIVLLCVSTLAFSHDDASFYGKYVGINEEKEVCEITILKEVRPGYIRPAVFYNQKDDQSYAQDFIYLDTAAVAANKESFKSEMKVFVNQRDELHLIKFNMSRDAELQKVSAARKQKSIFSVLYRKVSSFECGQLKKIR